MADHPPAISRRQVLARGSAALSLHAPSAWEVTAGIGYRWPEHVHGELEIILPLAGGYRCRIGERVVDASVGQVVVLQPGDRHQDLLHGGERWAAWGAKPLLGRRVLPLLATSQRVRDDQEGRLRAAWDALNRLSPPHPAAALAREAMVVSLCWQALALFPSADFQEAARRMMADASTRQRLRDALRQTADAGGSVADLGRSLGLGADALRRRCHALLGQAPAQALAELRLAEARSQLRAGSSVTAVAELLGFSTPFAFSRAYRGRFGLPPSRERGAGNG